MITLVIVVVALVAAYLYNVRNFDYWKKKGVPHDKPVVFFGNNFDNYTMKLSLSQIFERIYWKYPHEKVVGFFRSSRPELVIRDPELVKRILVTDFSYFHMRGVYPHKKVIETILRNLFFVEGDLWRMLRQRMTPAFTSSKLKAMFYLIVERAERLQERTRKIVGQTVDARDHMARYTTDFIGACGFGLDSGALEREDSAFRKLGVKAFNIGIKEAMNATLKEAFPELAKNLKLLPHIEKETIDLIMEVQRARNFKPSGRNDFIDLMLQAKERGPIEVDSIEKFRSDGTPERITLELDEKLVIAQVFAFFIAGFETSSASTSFTLLQLAYYPEEMRKVQEDIDKVLAKYDNKLTYESVKEMHYLECAFKESMRVFPPLGYLMRESTTSYTFPGTDVTIEKGVIVNIPCQAMHTDPQYWEDPLEFRPSRFLPENLTATQKMIFLPFGDGPRSCIGERLGQMQSMAGLAAVLSKFDVEPAKNSVRFPPVDPRINILQAVKDGIPIVFRERKDCSS